jgi:O-antigen ligase
MIDYLIELILIFLFIFTPIAFGSLELWAISLTELGILLIIIFFVIQNFFLKDHPIHPFTHLRINLMILLLSLFLILILFQIIPLPSGMLKIISPKTYELRQSLGLESSTSNFQLSFVPFLTRIEFFKWLTLAGFFLFLLSWRLSNRPLMNQLIPVIMLVGIAESLYGMFEFFSGHGHILHLDLSISYVYGTFINRNNFAGYLEMVIPLSMGYLFSRETLQRSPFMGWRNRLSSLDGKALLIAFGIMVMILGLLFSSSRMGILSLLLSFSLLSLLFRDRQKKKRYSKTSVLILVLALLWAAWIGLDAVISRFFSTSETLEERWSYWMDTFQIFKDFPLFGSGLGTFVQIYPMYRSIPMQVSLAHAENDYLELVSEVGLIGVGLLLILFSFLLYKGVSGIRSLSPSQSERYIGMGGLVSVLALMFHSVIERNIQVPANALLYTFIWALILKISIRESRETRLKNSITQ